MWRGRAFREVVSERGPRRQLQPRFEEISFSKEDLHFTQAQRINVQVRIRFSSKEKTLGFTVRFTSKEKAVGFEEWKPSK